MESDMPEVLNTHTHSENEMEIEAQEELRKAFQNMPNETPKAMEGTTSGTLTRRSNIEDINLPAFCRAMIIAVGKPIITLSIVTAAPKP